MWLCFVTLITACLPALAARCLVSNTVSHSDAGILPQFLQTFKVKIDVETECGACASAPIGSKPRNHHYTEVKIKMTHRHLSLGY